MAARIEGGTLGTRMPIFRSSRTLSWQRLLAAVFALCGLLLPWSSRRASAAPPNARTLDEYRHFRITSLDLLGRMPTRAELAAFERPDFDAERWLDSQLTGEGYAERLTRVYMDALRLEPNQNFSAAPAQLFRQEITGPDGQRIAVYFRENQRRIPIEIDGEFCLSPKESGLVVRARTQTSGTPLKVSAKLLEERTVLVKPWWLYGDYRAAEPSKLFGSAWPDADPGYQPVESLLSNADGKPVTEVRVCREEAATNVTGHVYTSGRAAPPKAAPGAGKRAPLPKAAKRSVPLAVGQAAELAYPGGRIRPPPADKPFALQHRGEALACDTKAALDFTTECGCGVGLERCIPSDSANGGTAFYFPNHSPLGPDSPLDNAKQSAQRWYPYWWSREAARFLANLFAKDRDFREILTSKETFVNGPLAQFYRSIQRGNCCGPEAGFGMSAEKEPLFDPASVPADLEPYDVSRWERVADRGEHAAGILTMPMFLEKYASARARAAAVYNDFLCKSFIAENQQLAPSSEPNLTVRPGCKTCHATLEPMAAYFARIEPGNFVFLPQDLFPVQNRACKLDKNGHLNGNCNALYDPAFVDPTAGATLRSAYASAVRADATPVGLAREVTTSAEFASCATERVTSSFLGRALTPDDAPLLRSLTREFTGSGYRMRALVRAIARSAEYRTANDLRSSPTPVSTP